VIERTLVTACKVSRPTVRLMALASETDALELTGGRIVRRHIVTFESIVDPAGLALHFRNALLFMCLWY